MKLSGIDGINYSRLASLYKLAQTSNDILCIRTEGLQQIKPGSQLAQTLIHWADIASSIEDSEDKAVFSFQNIDLSPDNPHLQSLINLVESIPTDSILIALPKDSQINDMKVYGLGSDMLPNNAQQLL
jgi:hypothetical protein